METPVRFGDIARMVAAQLCFLGAMGAAIVAGMLAGDRLQADVVAAIAVLMGVSAGATGIGVVLLSRRVSDGFLVALGAAIALVIALSGLHLWASYLDFGGLFGGGRT